MAQFTLTSTDTVPRSSSITGAITTYTNSKTITGSGTAFLTNELKLEILRIVNPEGAEDLIKTLTEPPKKKKAFS